MRMKCIKNILVYLFIINGARAQFRKDYKYHKRTDSYYKFHIESMSNARAAAVCEAEDSTLMVVTSEADTEIAHGLLKAYPDLDGHAWISTDGKNHDPVEDDDNDSRDAIFTAFNVGPKCTMIERYGEVWTAPCHTSYAFICKTEARDVQYDSRCKVYVKGYQYFDAVKSCYKIPLYAASWNEAYSYCQAEGAHLAVVNSVAEQQVLRNLTNTVRVVGSNVKWFFYVGIRAEKVTNGETPVFKTIFDQPLAQSGFNEWCPNEPNNRGGNQYCGTIFKTDGRYNDEDCSQALGFICEIEV